MPGVRTWRSALWGVGAPSLDQPDHSRHNQRTAQEPAHALPCPDPHLAHHELLALEHLTIGREEGGDAPDFHLVESLALPAAPGLALVQLVDLTAVALRLLIGVLVGCECRVAHIDRADPGKHILGAVEEGMVRARRNHQPRAGKR